MATNPDDALEQIANAPDFNEEGLAEAVIELTDDDMGGESIADYAAPPEEPAEPEVVEEAPEPRKRQPRADIRIRELAAEREALAAERDAIRAERDAARAAEAEAMHAMTFHYHASLKTEAQAIKSQLAEAKRNGESDAEIDLQTRLNLVTMRMEEASEALQAAPPRAAPAAAPVPREEPRAAPPVQQPQAQPAPQVAEWIGRNTWFNPASADYDPEMRTYAEAVGTQINMRLARQGKEKEIGNAAYWMEIDRQIRTEFPDAFDDPAPRARAVPPMTRDATVAPVVRGGAPAPGAPSGNSVRLSAEERQLAHSMAANGAFNKPGGGRPTPAEAERIYAAQKLKQQRTA